MDAMSNLGKDIQNKNSTNIPKIKSTNLHDAIDKVAEKAKPAIDNLAESAHRKVELLANRAEKIEDIYHNYLDTSRKYVKSHPLTSVGAVMFFSFALTKLMTARHKKIQ